MILTQEDIRFPMEHLKSMSREIPAQLFFRGDLDLLLFDWRCVAIIGTRSPTPYGEELAFDIAKTLAKKKVIIVSGLAYGIDREAHEGALAGNGKTVAIPGSPLHKIYPPEHTDLAERIVKTGGLLMTEQEMESADPQRFVARDKIVAALCDTIIPVQATYMPKGNTLSGTLQTVNEAIRLGKKIIIPKPDEKDEKNYPDRYEGLRYLMHVYRNVKNVVVKEIVRKSS